MSDNTFPAKRKSSIWLILLVLVAIAASAGGGYSWWLLHKSKPTNTQIVAAIPVFMPLETFTVNLITPDNNLDRVLYIGLTLRLPTIPPAPNSMTICRKFAAACCYCFLVSQPIAYRMKKANSV